MASLPRLAHGALARILGVGDRFGAIAVGKAADLVLASGDLLEARTDTRHTELNRLFQDRQ